MLTIKARYAWNGCSPKVKIFSMVFGTPEGALPEQYEEKPIKKNLKNKKLENLSWDKPKTYFASALIL